MSGHGRAGHDEAGQGTGPVPCRHLPRQQVWHHTFDLLPRQQGSITAMKASRAVYHAPASSPPPTGRTRLSQVVFSLLSHSLSHSLSLSLSLSLSSASVSLSVNYHGDIRVRWLVSVYLADLGCRGGGSGEGVEVGVGAVGGREKG